ncbi:MAG: DUF6439 family protein [Cyanobacteria bacterium P01_G01_bin.54]
MPATSPTSTPLQDQSTLALAQALAERLTIAPIDWHRHKGNRKAQASQQIAASLSFLLHDEPELALEHLKQAVGWLDRSLSPPPCPTHGTPKQGA